MAMKLESLSYRTTAIVLVLISSFNVYSQNISLTTNNAYKKIQVSKFDEGIKLYHKALSKDSTYFKANSQLAFVYSDIIEMYDSAVFYYERAFRHQKKDTNYFNYYSYANSLRLTNKPKKSIQNFKLFKQNQKLNPNNKEDVKLGKELDQNIAYCQKSIEKFKTQVDTITVTNVGENINTDNNEYTSVFVKNNTAIIYNGRHKDFKDELLFMDDQYFENIYCYQLNDNTAGICNLSENQSTHYAIVNSVKGTDSLLIYFENQLWISQYDDYTITERTPLPSILRGFYQQPTGVFSKDQNTFIFSAKRTNFDDLNLYISHKNELGKWSNPKKIEALNSNQDEDSPFLSEDGQVIYFSSKGHKSSGDYDIFKSTFINNEWSEPENLNYPINSPGDDVFYEINSNGLGFLSSNRDGGYGLMDIYEVKFISKVETDSVLTQITFVEGDSLSTIDLIKNNENEKVNEVAELTNENATDIRDNYEPILDLLFDPIYFGFNKFNLDDKAKIEIDKLLNYLESNKNVKLIITGHTDSKGTVAYNKILSNQRINSTIKYLNYKNLSKNRILKTMNIGEEKPKFSNTLTNGLDNEEGRKLNRKVEFYLYK